MISVFDEKENCCGCTACKNICPMKSIKMRPDKEGFLYPDINQKLCIDCGLCRKVCPLQNQIRIDDRFKEPKVFAVKHKDNNVKMKSAAGGAYTAISDYALKISNAIYGAEFSDNFYVHHSRATTCVERDNFRGSKYVQSDLKETFKQIREDLTNGKGVLFTGTACQVAGLRKYLDDSKTNADKLILNDIICHGTPSPLLWGNYLKFIQTKGNLKSYTFRNKDNGWRGYNIKANFKNNKERINSPDVRVFANIFASDLALRPSCYHCKFTNLQRPSDIMIGDFWGVEKILPEIDDNKGVSLVLINTPKGKEIFERIKTELEVWEIDIKDCLQPNLQHPTNKPAQRTRFWEDYYKFGFEYIAKKYGKYNIKNKLKYLTKIILFRIGVLNTIKKLR